MTPLLPAAFVAAALLSGVLLWRRRTPPPAARCPRCGAPVAERSGDGASGSRARKCPECRWRARGATVADRRARGEAPTGGFFEWGEERFPRDFGFRWGDTSGATTASEPPPPDDPSGFRWKDDGPAG